MFSAWGGVVLLTLLLNPLSLFTAPFFPIGLLALFPHGEDRAITAWQMQFPVLLGWGFYLAIQAILMRMRRETLFFVCYAFLCVLLVLNVAGCQRVLAAAAQIH